jgi:hypothetical protein
MWFLERTPLKSESNLCSFAEKSWKILKESESRIEIQRKV